MTVIVRRDGTVWAWGSNEYGQLGDGSTIDSSVPVQVKNLTSVVGISAGHNHTVALRTDGTVWNWGSNEYGQLGDSIPIYSPVPVYVKNLTEVVAISAGTLHTVAARSDGSVWAWGENSRGQLGDGSEVNSSVPVQVQNLASVTAISAGKFDDLYEFFTVALKSAGTVWAWGSNDSGKLGNGTTNSSLVPILVGHLVTG